MPLNNSMENVRLNAKLTPLLNRIHEEEIELDEYESENNSRIVKNLVQYLVNAMTKIDLLFRSVYNGIGYTGSFWEKLRVKSATEFDINIILMPFNSDDVEVVGPEHAPGSFQCRLKRDINQIGNHQFFSKEGYLLRTEFQRWIKGLINTALEHYKTEDIESIEQPPGTHSFTYKITLNSGIIINIDVVPIIYLGPDHIIPNKIFRSKRFKRLNKESKIWFLVPLQYKADSYSGNQDTLWRISFPLAEKDLIPDDVKKLIKLFKLLKDTQKWNKIKSYHIKTLFSLELDGEEERKKRYKCYSKLRENFIRRFEINFAVNGLICCYTQLSPFNCMSAIGHVFSEYNKELTELDIFINKQEQLMSNRVTSAYTGKWSNKQLGDLFIKMLLKLQLALSLKMIPNYFNREVNLLNSMDQTTATNYANQVQKIVEDITNCPENVEKYFVTRPQTQIATNDSFHLQWLLPNFVSSISSTSPWMISPYFSNIPSARNPIRNIMYRSNRCSPYR